MLKSKLTLLLTCLLFSAGARAEPTVAFSSEAIIKATIEQRMPGSKVESVRPTPYSGLYELRIGEQIFYTDKTAQYLIEGSIINTRTMENLTKARLDDINKIKFSDLPLELAVKTVKGNGKRVIALFEDPNCPYCKRLHQQALKAVDNTTVYTFLYNVITPESAAKSKNIWCAPDRNLALEEWMVDGKTPAGAAADCVNPNEPVLALGSKLHVSSTPTIFFADGTRISGAPDGPGLEARLATVK